MNRLAYINVLAIVTMFSASAFAQSLAQAAKKEKERRAKNSESSATVKVIDENELKNARGENYSTTGESSSSSSNATNRGRTSPTRATADSGRLSSTSGGTKRMDAVGDRRAQCEAQLKKAEADKKQLQAQFEGGVVEVATIDTTTGPKPPEGGITLPRREMVGRDHNGVPIYVNPGQPEAKVDVEGARVSCQDALRFPSRYPKQSRQCSDIKRKIEAAEEEIRRALECVRAR